MREKREREREAVDDVASVLVSLLHSHSEMVDQGILGWIFASLLGFVVFRSVLLKNKKKGGVSVEIRDECVKSTANGECRSKTACEEADVIIVGAGVAGAALANTLGKVISLLWFCWILIYLRWVVPKMQDSISKIKLPII